MGIFKNLKAVRSIYQEGVAGVEKWARITAIRPGIAGACGFDLEIHNYGQLPYLVNTVVFMPRGVTPQVGQDVAYRYSTHDGADHYEIEWDQPPVYGRPPRTGPIQPPT